MFQITYHTSIKTSGLYIFRSGGVGRTFCVLRGFHGLIIDECHTSALLGHLGARKMVNLLYQHV